MSLLTIEGTYKDGKIELAENPDWLGGETPVLVTFLRGSRHEPSPKDEVDDDREAKRQRAFARMEAGLHLGGPPYPHREELHDRFDR
jgi:hypothetical protein